MAILLHLFKSGKHTGNLEVKKKGPAYSSTLLKEAKKEAYVNSKEICIFFL